MSKLTKNLVRAVSFILPAISTVYVLITGIFGDEVKLFVIGYAFLISLAASVIETYGYEDLTSKSED